MVLLNNNIDKISNYPFDRLRSLLSNTNTTEGFINIDLSIGQPYQKTPNFIKEIISSSFDKWHFLIRSIVFVRLFSNHPNSSVGVF